MEEQIALLPEELSPSYKHILFTLDGFVPLQKENRSTVGKKSQIASKTRLIVTNRSGFFGKNTSIFGKNSQIVSRNSGMVGKNRDIFSSNRGICLIHTGSFKTNSAI